MGNSWRPVERGPSASSLSSVSTTTDFLTSLPSFPQLEIPPSLFLLGPKAQRGDSLAWRHTVSLLSGPVSEHPGTLFPAPSSELCCCLVLR